MSLVAYAESDSSDNEDTERQEATKELCDVNSDHDLFAKLPAPKGDVSSGLQDIVVRQSSKNKRAKILIPSLDDFGDDEDEGERRSRKLKPSKTGSGLVGLLPAPKNAPLGATQLTPHVLTKKPAEATKQPARQPPVSEQTQTSATQKGNTWSDDEDGESPSTFFSFGEPAPPQIPTLTAVPGMTVVEELVEDQYVGTRTYEDGTAHIKEDANLADQPLVEPSAAVKSRKGKIVWSEHDEPGTVPHDIELDDGALVRLRGRRNEEINIIDVNAADQIDKQQVMVKGLTEEQTYKSPSDKSDFHTTQMHRRKHQITYLAQQAKEREQELKNMWAQNRMTRKQTQAKYGF